jgi:uncharacterized protein (TIGR00725 family)
MRKTIIGIMGPGNQAHEVDIQHAEELGALIAQAGWVLLTGGRKAGVMDAASRGAKNAHGLTLGILPTADLDSLSDAVDIVIRTDMGNARNNINVLSSDVVIACGMGLGTASEVALALKNGKPVILLNSNQDSEKFFKGLSPEKVFVANTATEAIHRVKTILSNAV